MSTKVVAKVKQYISASGLSGSSKDSDTVLQYKTELYQYFSKNLNPDSSLVRDDRTISGKISSTDNIPIYVKELIDECISTLDKSLSKKWTLYYYVGFKNTETVISPPNDNVIARVLYNIGNREIYTFESSGISLKTLEDLINKKSKSDSMNFDGQSIMLTANSYVMLGYKTICDYKIKVSGRAPQNTPISITANGKHRAPMKFLRPNSYHRITIVIDFDDTDNKITEMDNIIHETINNMDIKDMQKLASNLKSNTLADDSDMNITKQDIKNIKKIME